MFMRKKHYICGQRKGHSFAVTDVRGYATTCDSGYRVKFKCMRCGFTYTRFSSEDQFCTMTLKEVRLVRKYLDRVYKWVEKNAGEGTE